MWVAAKQTLRVGEAWKKGSREKAMAIMQELVTSVCTQVVALGVDNRSNYKMLRRQNWDDSLLAEEVRGRERNFSGGFAF